VKISGSGLDRRVYAAGESKGEWVLAAAPPATYAVVLSAILFGIGALGFVFKRNIITIFMSIELMLNAVNLSFVAFSRLLHVLDGQVFVFFVIVVAAAEASVGMAIILQVARNRHSLNIERIDLMKL
jgi:NADH-quinone oxidoreductase subunit K